MSFKDFKKNRGANIEKLQKALEKNTNSYVDDRFWSYEMDKAGTASAKIRFLPAKDSEKLPWITKYSHGFKNENTGKWYIENCPTSIDKGDDCVICQSNNKLWNSGHDDDKEIVRSRKRKLAYIANILVLEDKANPDNEGKVFLFQFGSKIWDQIKSAMQPEFEDVKAIDPFNFWEGADFNLRVRRVEGYANYEKSSFEAPSELFGGDDSKLEEIYDSLYDIYEFIDPKEFKSREALLQKFKSVVGEKEATYLLDLEPSHETVTAPSSRSTFNENAVKEDEESVVGGEDGVSVGEEETEEPVNEKDTGDDEEDAMAYFRNLANNA